MQHGIINIFKEKDYTSHDVVARLRGILNIKKIGHTGTLDPDAEGVLPICIGKATKLSDFLTNKDKTYVASMILGLTTDTQDITGEVLTKSKVDITEDDLHRVAKSYIGAHEQLPPMYSALSVNGIKLYKLARQGIEVKRKKRPIFINNINIIEYNKELHQARIEIDCEKGTYIRTLLHDIGQVLGCGGTTKDLLRTRAGDFTIENSLKLSEVEDLVRSKEVNNYIKPIDSVLTNYPRLIVNEESDTTIQNGNPLKKSSFINSDEFNIMNYKDLIRIYDYQNNFIALYQFDFSKNSFVPKKMFI
ncbi:MAG TPA: tRNA pseudouridine(55) synthase TruB [Clostridiales bacterium]|nr:tRNA pseudouridine(55) synthase TruB [Clostridiales bacterium]